MDIVDKLRGYKKQEQFLRAEAVQLLNKIVSVLPLDTLYIMYNTVNVPMDEFDEDTAFLQLTNLEGNKRIIGFYGWDYDKGTYARLEELDPNDFWRAYYSIENWIANILPRVIDEEHERLQEFRDKNNGLKYLLNYLN